MGVPTFQVNHSSRGLRILKRPLMGPKRAELGYAERRAVNLARAGVGC
jgi:hypothetical protein